MAKIYVLFVLVLLGLSGGQAVASGRTAMAESDTLKKGFQIPGCERKNRNLERFTGKIRVC